MKKIQEILEWIWLSENEAKIYLTLLKLWKSWVTNISKYSEIKRTTIYNYINPLLEKDFIKRTISWKRILFTAENPKNLIKIFEERKNNFLKKLPILEWFYNESSSSPKLEFYEGKNWIKKIYEEVWSSGQDLMAFFSPEYFYKIFDLKYDKYLENLEKKNWWKTKNLLVNNNFWREHIKNFNGNSSKLLPKEFKLEVDIIIVKNSIIMVSFEPMYVIKLKNKPLSDFHRNLFNYFWKILK